MKNYIFALLLLNLSLAGSAQMIKGTVYDKNTGDIISYATVYFNGTFVGTSSDQNGNFELRISRENRSMPITVSCIGYHSVTVADFSEDEALDVYLQAHLYEISDVTIRTKSLERKRKRYLKLLKEELIGTTVNARGCKILNEEDISFNYHSDEDTVKAYALAPILIENKSLGYKITYYLDRFEYYKGTQFTFFSGNLIFKEDLTDKDEQAPVCKKRREFTYLGSRMHFFRVLWSGQLKKSGYKIRDQLNKALKADDIILQDGLNNKYLSHDTDLSIEYMDHISFIKFVDQPVYFDSSGFFNPGIKWEGYMALQRIADMMPYEYTLE